MSPVLSYGFAVIFYAAFYVVAYQKRAYYLAFCVIVMLAVGVDGLAYAPLFWLPVEMVFMVREWWRGKS